MCNVFSFSDGVMFIVHMFICSDVQLHGQFVVIFTEITLGRVYHRLLRAELQISDNGRRLALV